ncbi:Asp-tRNA(Asn)/Glu-tRNA(Gln) amidotransferase subunit GatC [Candidatus Poriferisodalis sp.]|uniref:Asp-tRNA(Asn)/Glu-tRNA(Gln) amidotransferase subunit GatC n=1 Tax=Candidatus Poriferisodalis sp. TaxID=3101277 RepID=UPI003B029322
MSESTPSEPAETVVEAPNKAPDGAPAEAISTEQVSYVARLARIELTQPEIEHFTSHLARVLSHARELSDLDLSDVPPLAHPYPLRNVFRDDVVGGVADRDEVLAQAPAAEHGQFAVPPVLGGAS